MNTPEFLNELRRLDVRVESKGDRLVCNAPTGTLTPDLREQIRTRKQEILDFLRSATALARQQPAIVPLNAQGSRMPVYAVPGHNGDVFCYRALASHLGADQPLFGLQPPGLDGASQALTSVPELAEYFARQIRASQPRGPAQKPIIVAGFCAGGGIALELACRLQESGVPVAFLMIFGSPFPKAYRFWSKVRINLLNAARRVLVHWKSLRAGDSGGMARYAWERLRAVRDAHGRARENDTVAAADPILAMRRAVEDITIRALVEYEPRKFSGPGMLVVPSEPWRKIGDNGRRWRTVIADYSEFVGPEGCNGDNMLLEPHVRLMADVFRSKLPD